MYKRQVLGGGIMVQPYILERIHTRIPQMVMSSFTHVQVSNAKLGNLSLIQISLNFLRVNEIYFILKSAYLLAFFFVLKT